MAQHTEKVGWIGMGRMGYPMAERLLKAGYDVSIWNRTRSKAEPLAKIGGKVVDKLSDLSGMDVVFSIVAEGKDVEQVYLGKDGVLSRQQDAGRVRRLLDHLGRGIRRHPQAPERSAAPTSSARQSAATPR
jgi:3-hydroxyisobutyrate dehydrogenase